MFVYHNVKGIPSPSFTSESEIFKLLLILHSSPGLFKVFFALAAVTILYKCFPTRKGWKGRKGKVILQRTSKQSWKHCIMQSTLSTTFSKDIQKLFWGNNSSETIHLHNLSNCKSMAKKLQSKHRIQNTSSPMTADSNVHDLGGFLREVLCLGQMMVSICRVLCCSVLPHSLHLPTNTRYPLSAYQASPGLYNALNPTRPRHVSHPHTRCSLARACTEAECLRRARSLCMFCTVHGHEPA